MEHNDDGKVSKKIYRPKTNFR